MVKQFRILPRRGFFGFVLTAAGALLVVSFRTPDAPPIVLGLPSPDPVSSAVPLFTSAPVQTSVPGATNRPTPVATPVTTQGAASGYKNGTFGGQPVNDPFGTVQVAVVISDGKITDVQTLQVPSDGTSGRINRQAVPVLHDEALAAQSAKINLLSGATWTSEAYASSLQSALDAAKV